MASTTLDRAVQYARLSRDVLRGRISRDQQVKQTATRMIAERLGRMRGLPQKVGQMLSFGESEEQENPFAQLRESAEPMPLDEALGLLEKSWGRPPEQFLTRIDSQGKAASIGQVHKAKLTDGREVAIKVQYPGIKRAVMIDLNLLGWLSMPMGNLRRGFDLQAYRRMILTGLEEELDYRIEAKFQRRYAEGPGRDPFVVVPEVIESLSTEHVLVSQWREGKSFDEVCASWSPQSRRAVGDQMVRWFLSSIFDHGLLHADLHPGNVRFLASGDQPKLLLYDFGSMFQPSDTQRLALLRLLRSTLDESESPYPLFLSLGFQAEYLEPLQAKLPALCKILFEPLIAEYPFDVRDWNLGERVTDLLGDDRLNFRIAGPPALVYLLRAFHCLRGYLQGLDARIQWRTHLMPILKRHATPMAQLPIPPTNVATGYEGLAKYLKIQVRRGNRVTAQITCEGSAIDNLEELIDPQTLTKIRNANIDLQHLVREVRQRGYTPGEVFELQDDEKCIAVWLE
ncbi:MAG: AarF/ABC1/UbiB kinase family protein [Pirellulaceae bacterium]